MSPQSKDMVSISIVMPCYNEEKDIGRAVASVLAQTITDFELLVVNDGSTDTSSAIVEGFGDKRIRIIDQENKGVSAARNRGIGEAQSDIIAFLDADDEWKPHFLASILHLQAKYPQCAVFATGYLFLTPEGVEDYPRINGLATQPWSGILGSYFHIASLSDPPLCSSSIAITRKALRAINGFPVGITSGEDLLTWAKLAAQYPIGYDTSPLAIIRQSASVHQPPTRIPDTADPVGRGLKKLQNDIPQMQLTDLKHYIAWWHKGRAGMFLRLGQRGKAVREIGQMGCYHLDRKFFIYCICVLLPLPLVRQLYLLRNKTRR